MKLAGSSGLCCFHEKMTSQGPWLDFFLSKMAKNSARKVALPLALVPHNGEKNAASYHGLWGTPRPTPRKHAVPVFSNCIAWIKIACNRAVHAHRCFWTPVARPQGSGAAVGCRTSHDGSIWERAALEQAARSHHWHVLCAVGSSASPLGKCVENWECRRITDPSFLQCSFLLQPFAGTGSSTPWRVLLFHP